MMDTMANADINMKRQPIRKMVGLVVTLAFPRFIFLLSLLTFKTTLLLLNIVGSPGLK